MILACILICQISYGQRDSIVVKLFLLEDCVICQSYSLKINDLVDNFGDKVSFQGYFPNFSSKKEEIASFKEKYKIDFDLKTDYFKSVSKKYNITVTPEVVVVNETKNEILYRGRIDDEFVTIGKRRRVVTTNELYDALLSIANNEEIRIKETQAVGCFINYNDIN